MRLSTVVSFAMRLVARPHVIVPAALLALGSLLSPLSVDDASAQSRTWRPASGMSRPAPKRYPATTYPSRRPYPSGNSAGRYPYPSGSGSNRYPPRHPTTQSQHPSTQYPKLGDRYPSSQRRPYPGTYAPAAVTSVPAGPVGPVAQPQQIVVPPITRRAGTGVPPANERRYVPNEVITETANDQTQALGLLARNFGLTQLQTATLQLTGTTITRWRINGGRSVPAIVRALETQQIVLAVQPNYVARLQQTQASAPANRPERALDEYGPARLRLPEAHALATGNRVLIAVIDSGADTTHPELAGLIVDTFDAIGTGDRVHPHGTGIVGAITAHARLTGAAPGARVIVARAFGAQARDSEGTTYAILRSLDWAASRGARVINMSFAGPLDPAIQRAITSAHARGIVLIAAAGNAGPNSPALYPAAYPEVIAVTATDENDRLFPHANRGSYIAVAAPGVDLWLAAPRGQYQMASGTSFSAAAISGAIALMLERNPNLTPDAVRQALIATARDLGPPGIDPEFGAGLVDAYRAILRVAPPASPAPVTAGASTQGR